MSGEITAPGGVVMIAAKQAGKEVLHLTLGSGHVLDLTVTPEMPVQRDLAACDNIRLVNLAINQGFALSGDAETHNALMDFQRLCDEVTVAWPEGYQALDPDADPAASDGAPVSGTTPAAQTAAPDPEPTVTAAVFGPPSGKVDGRTLNEQRNDPTSPLQDYDVAAVLSSTGVAENDLSTEVQRVQRNDPPAGSPHPTFSADDRPDKSTVGDPVLAFTGQFSLACADLEIPSRGFPLRFVRNYLSGEPYFGPLGYNWDHSYNIYLRPLADGRVALWTGSFREEIYRPVGDGFEPPLGVRRRLRREGGGTDSYVLSDVEGFQHVFARPPGWPIAERIPLVTLRDRHDTKHELEYDGQGRLDRVVDQAGRFLQFAYGSCNLLEAVFDHVGRRWTYLHDSDVEHLVEVTSPPTSDFPAGIRSIYHYDRYQGHPCLQHNIVRTCDSTGQILVDNEYGQDPASDNFARLQVQVVGDHRLEMCATRLQFVPRVPNAINAPALRVESNEGGLIKVSTFNYRGDILDERCLLTRDGSLRVCAKVWNYDEQGNCIVQRHPDGGQTRLTYDSGHADPLARGNLLKVEKVAPFGNSTPARILLEMTYEPTFHRLKTRRDEAGRTTTYIYDHELTVGAKGEVVRIDYPAATLPDGTLQAKSIHFEQNGFGQVIRTTSAEGRVRRFDYSGSGTSAGYLVQTVQDPDGFSLSTRFSHDSFGLVSAMTAPGERTSRIDYNALGQIEGMTLPQIDGAVSETLLHYRETGQVERIERPLGAYAEPGITDPFLVDRFDYDVMGRCIAGTLVANTPQAQSWKVRLNMQGQPLVEQDALGNRTERIWDERGLLLSEIRAAGGADAVTTRFSYDRAGRLVRTTGADGAVTKVSLDAWGRTIRTERPDGSVLTRKWGKLDELAETRIEGIAVPGEPVRLLRRETFEYDERSRVVRRTLWSFDEEPAAPLTTSFTYDADNLLVEVTPPRGPALQFVYDAVGRLKRSDDGQGNARVNVYDDSGDLVEVRQERAPGAGAVRKVVAAYSYDGRDRRVEVDVGGRSAASKFDDRNLMVELNEPDGVVKHFVQDAAGRLVERVVDPSGVSLRSRWAYDLMGKTLSFTDPLGETTQWTYDGLGRVRTLDVPGSAPESFDYAVAERRVSRKLPSGATITVTMNAAGHGPDEISTSAGSDTEAAGLHRFSYDGLGRMVRAEVDGSVVARRYDSLGRLVQELAMGEAIKFRFDDASGSADLVFPDGRTERTLLDPNGRPSSVKLVAPGLLGGTADGTLLSLEYQAGQPARFVYGNGVETRLVRDGPGRVMRTDHISAGTALDSLRTRWDVRGRRVVTQRLGAGGGNIFREFDRNDRLISARWGFSLSALADVDDAADRPADVAAAELAATAAPAGESFTLDFADVRRAQTEPGGAVTAYDVVPGHRTVKAGSETIAYHLDGQRAADGSHIYDVDSLGRICRIREKASGATILELGYDALGRIASGKADGQPFNRWFAGPSMIQERRGAALVSQRSLHPLWPFAFRAANSGEERYLLYDDTLSLMAVTDSSGQVRERLRFAPFGTAEIVEADGVTPVTDPSVEPVWRGMERDGTTGLYLTAHRAYDPRLGLFLSPDPLMYRDSPSRYAFAAHNPADFLDPTGLGRTSATEIQASGSGTVGEEHSELWKWAYNQTGVWWYAPYKDDFWPQVPSYNTGSIWKNILYNGWMGISNFIAWFLNRGMDGWGTHQAFHELRLFAGITDGDIEAVVNTFHMPILNEELMGEALAQLVRPLLGYFSSWARFQKAFEADRAIPPMDGRNTISGEKMAEALSDALYKERGFQVLPTQFGNNTGLDRAYTRPLRPVDSLGKPVVTEVKYDSQYRRGQLNVALERLTFFGNYNTGARQGSWRYTYLRSGNLISWPSATPEMQEAGWLLQRNLMTHRRTMVIVNEWLELEEFDLEFWGMYDDMF